ncbi:MAG: hypothetical protein M3M87_01355 [Thermoproteota archaeon]|nr:hypothetical protein [Thermoproteota archaeon]
MSDDELLKGTEKFLKLNNYSSIQYNRVFDQEGRRSFSSPIVASRRTRYDEEERGEEIDETIVSIFQSNLKKYDLSFLGFVESVTFSILDNYESTNPMLVTDSLSYFYMIKDQEISVAIEDMMREGLFVLFLNHRFTYAFFDKFENMTKPIPVYE